MYVHIAIGEAIGKEQMGHLRRIFRDEASHRFREEKGFEHTYMATESDGHTIVIMTAFEDRPSARDFHSSAAYQEFVDETKDLLIGPFVVKFCDLEQRP